MAGKIKGCTHHSSKVLKMAGGGSVPELKTGGKRLPYMTKKNSDGSQQYVRGETDTDRHYTAYKSWKSAPGRAYDDAKLRLGRAMEEEFKPIKKRIDRITNDAKRKGYVAHDDKFGLRPKRGK